MSLYIGIPNVTEIRRDILECKRKIYLLIRGALKRKKTIEREIDKIEKAYMINEDIKNLITKLREILPKIEEKKEEKKRGKKVRKLKKQKIEEKVDELEKLEEELKKIEEELKKLA